ncbi:hypothetical protein B0F90DRAFT_1628398 [Multifurca ochricompacta]|uniref:Uncharacterized protein n=1 Tax=Multifurca ochricompacta TaxID=376703 RepID=A0AAD4QMI8_9AGAM|nr:hypothetical protein B0F90DRAFT_1628398 [Multifurca ochricompacta]
MSANFNPYVQGWRVGNAPSGGSVWGSSSGEAPSIFGALPGGNPSRGRGTPPPPGSTIFYITGFRPNILNASVVDARGRQCYSIVTAASQPHYTTYYDTHRRTVALVDWSGGPPSVEMPGLFPRRSLRSWLQTASDRASRMMDVRGIPHVWVPDGDYICLYYAQNSHSHRLARISVSRDVVEIELSQHAMEARLAEVCILSASVFLSGQHID